MKADKNGNTGVDNTGKNNSGNWNSGDWNSGNGNSGNWNSGNGNSGDGNSGYWNSGNWNSGYWNSTDRESGMFNSTPGTVRMFNKPTELTWEEIDHPRSGEFYLCKWIDERDMTDEEKRNESEFHVRGGYLKEYSYKEAWANFWRDTDEDNRKKFLNLPNFDATVFEEITGIDVEKSDTVKIVCEGKEVEISRESAKALNLI